MKKPFLLFDFDGVIADSFHLAYEVNQKKCPHLTEEEYRRRFEGNINDAEEPVHTPDCRLDLDFFTEYVPRMQQEVKMFPEMREVITELEKTYTLVAISSTISSPIREFLQSHDLASHFVQIMGNDVHKSKVEKMKMVFAQYDVTADDCVFITDTLGDMREAERVGVGSIGVSWGFQSRETLEKGSSFRIVDTPQELVKGIGEYFSSRNGSVA